MTRNIEEIVNQDFGLDPAQAHAATPGVDHVAILLGLHNGAENLDDQLHSLAVQTHENWSLIVSDDGSTDDGVARLSRFAAGHDRNRIGLVEGPRKGFARNFLALAKVAGPLVPYAAFCDQDDIWLPRKLSRALAQLRDVPAGRPAIYTSRTVICDAAMRPLRLSPLFERPTSFANALVQNVGGGNTMVLNRAALDLVQATASHADGVIAHDWWVYQIVTGAGGLAIHDAEPGVMYRQHSGNVIGANDTVAARILRLAKLLHGRFRDWNDRHLAALEASAHFLTPASRATLTALQEVRRAPVVQRLPLLRQTGIYRQTRRGDIALVVAALTRRL